MRRRGDVDTGDQHVDDVCDTRDITVGFELTVRGSRLIFCDRDALYKLEIRTQILVGWQN